MQNCTDKLEFKFDNSADKLVSSLEYMLGHISGCIPAGADTEDLLFRCKVIITELLTNAIKHAGQSSTLFHIGMDEKKLVICKTDNGLPLYLIDANHHQSVQDKPDHLKKLISADPLSSLYANWESENHIRFTSEEGSLDDFLSVEEVMEHFGILIITNSSSEFTYTYKKETNANIFRVRIDF
jgi:hypothetical protein